MKSTTSFAQLLIALILAVVFVGCAQPCRAQAQSDVDKLKQIPVLVQQQKYAQARQLLNELRAAHPKSMGLEKLARELSPVWRLLPRHITAYTELSADDKKMVNDWNQQAQATPSFADLEKIRQFTLRNPNYPHGWVLQACLALNLNRDVEGKEAAQNLIDLGGANSLNPTFKALLVQLDQKGWLPNPEAIADASQN